MMSRREALMAMAAIPAVSDAAVTASFPSPKRPRTLRPGDQVALVCPAGAADGPEHFEKCVAKMETLGLNSVAAPNALKRHGYLGGTDAERAADMNWAIGDPDIKGIVAVRGGYGAMRILPNLDYQEMREHPKLLLGYSDITALHLAFLRKSGVVTFHGPCGESSWNSFAVERFQDVAMREDARPRSALIAAEGRCLVPGKARGRLIGGNLSLVAAMVGTPYGPQLDGAILFLEDIGEDPYRVDRMLTHLWLTGHLSRCAGIAFGNFRARKPPEGASTEVPDPAKTFSLDQVLEDRTRLAGVPAARGFPFGHIADNATMPLGVLAELDAEKGTLTFLEPAVR